MLKPSEETLQKTFHHKCIRTNRQQCTEHVTMAELRRRWRDTEMTVDKIRIKRLEWLGQLARMADKTSKTILLNGRLSPFCVFPEEGGSDSGAT